MATGVQHIRIILVGKEIGSNVAVINGNLKGLLIKHNIIVIHHGEIINGIGVKEK